MFEIFTLYLTLYYSKIFLLIKSCITNFCLFVISLQIYQTLYKILT